MCISLKHSTWFTARISKSLRTLKENDLLAYRTMLTRTLFLCSLRNDFLDNSRYAKIAYHVATTMETVNLNEMTLDQPLAHLVGRFRLVRALREPRSFCSLFSAGVQCRWSVRIEEYSLHSNHGRWWPCDRGVSNDEQTAWRYIHWWWCGHHRGQFHRTHGRMNELMSIFVHAKAFSVFCGLGIHNTRQYENVVRLTAKQNVAFEVLSYHVIASEEDVQRICQVSVPEATQVRLYSWEFNDMILTDDETILSSVRMFIELDLPKKFRIPHDVICRWMLSVKKNYRPVVYHNWRHAFNVAQTMFSMLTVSSPDVDQTCNSPKGDQSEQILSDSSQGETITQRRDSLVSVLPSAFVFSNDADRLSKKISGLDDATRWNTSPISRKKIRFSVAFLLLSSENPRGWRVIIQWWMPAKDANESVSTTEGNRVDEREKFHRRYHPMWMTHPSDCSHFRSFVCCWSWKMCRAFFTREISSLTLMMSEWARRLDLCF